MNGICDSHRVGSRLLLHHNHGTLLSVVVRLLGALLKGVVDAGYVAKIHVFAVFRAYHHVEHLAGVAKLALHTQRVGVGTDIEVTTRNVAVLSSDYRCNGLD